MLSTLVLLGALLLPLAPKTEPFLGPDVSADAVTGTWDGLYEPPGTVGGQPFALLLELDEANDVVGRLHTREGERELSGRFDGALGQLSLQGGTEGDDSPQLDLELALEDDRLFGQVDLRGSSIPIEARRASTKLLERDLVPPTLPLPAQRPLTITHAGLGQELAQRVDETVTAFAELHSVVGLSWAFVIDGEVADLRSLGWEDLEREVPASGETQYRWASISKPLTAVTAVRMTDAGTFDLERDVREWVPEFPDKGHPIRGLEILCHQSGVVHYRDAVRTWRTYEVEFPFEDRILALDLFESSPLLAPPGTRYSYSTHAFALLGAALERAGERPYEELVEEQVLEPLGMRATFPDFPSRTIAHRTQGYRPVEGGVVNVGDDDVSWKLPGGGWTSTVEDLALFAAGLLGEGLLDDDQKQLMWTRRTTADGATTLVGLGFFVGELDGRRSIQHGGSQRKSRTILRLLPGEDLGVVLMCNTEGTDVDELARKLLRLRLATGR